jgi:hypothetical protein
VVAREPLTICPVSRIFHWTPPTTLWARPVIHTPLPRHSAPLPTLPSPRCLRRRHAPPLPPSPASPLPTARSPTDHRCHPAPAPSRVSPSARGSEPRRSGGKPYGRGDGARTRRRQEVSPTQPLPLLLPTPISLLCFLRGSIGAPRQRGFRVYLLCPCPAGGGLLLPLLLLLRPRQRGCPPLGLWGRPRSPPTCQPKGDNFFLFDINGHPLQMPFSVVLGGLIVLMCF